MSGGVVPSMLLAAAAALAPAAAARGRQDIEVAFHNGEVTLAGTLSLPAGGARRWPVAIVISGDGPQDRDGGPGGSGIYRRVADSLVAEGVAVLRHDDRGAGRSSAAAGPPSYRALLGDTRAAVAYARARPELDPARVALIGHSEGATTAAVLAAEDPRIAAVVLLAGATAVNVDSLLLEQARRAPEGPAPRLLRVVAAARAGTRARGPDDLTDWVREHLEIAPRRVLPRVRCPVLILQGERDALVAAHHAEEAAAVLRAGGNRRVTVRVLPGLSHVFNHWAPGGEDSPRAREVDPGMLHELAGWVRTTLSAPARRG